MRSIHKLLALSAGLVLTATAAQAVTIVQYRQATSAPTLRLVNGGGQAFTVSSIGSPIVRATLFDPNNPLTELAIDARLSFNATGSGPASVSGGVASQDLTGGSFSLTALNPFTFLGQTGTDILSASFTGGDLTGVLGARNPTISVSLPVDAIFNVTSSFFQNSGFLLNNFSFTTSGASPTLRLANGRLANFRASSVGTFDAEPAIVPEPATWAMLIAGFGMVGFAARRRKDGVARVAA